MHLSSHQETPVNHALFSIRLIHRLWLISTNKTFRNVMAKMLAKSTVARTAFIDHTLSIDAVTTSNKNFIQARLPEIDFNAHTNHTRPIQICRRFIDSQGFAQHTYDTMKRTPVKKMNWKLRKANPNWNHRRFFLR